jgi:hypothetical protein
MEENCADNKTKASVNCLIWKGESATKLAKVYGIGLQTVLLHIEEQNKVDEICKEHY